MTEQPRLPTRLMSVLAALLTILTATDSSLASPYREIGSAIIAVCSALGIVGARSAIATHAAEAASRARCRAASEYNLNPKS
jgi:hypothetical protein